MSVTPRSTLLLPVTAVCQIMGVILVELYKVLPAANLRKELVLA
jgi:hypothetical protein